MVWAKPLLVFVLFTLLLSGCARQQHLLDTDPRTKIFLDLFPEAVYAQVALEDEEVLAIKDVIQQECGLTELPNKVIRASYAAPAASLSAYIVEGNIVCIVPKLQQDAFQIQQGNPAEVSEGTLVTVNGEAITRQDLQIAYSTLPLETRNTTELSVLVNRLIDEELLRQAAAGLQVGDAEVSTLIEQAMRNAGFAEINAFLENLNTSLEELSAAVKVQQQVARLLEQEGIVADEISSEEAERFYLANPDLFLVDERIRFRQLYISFNASGSRERADERLQEALAAVQQSDFCDAVRRFSDDESSKQSCGEYVTTRGLINPQLEAAVFGLPVNGSTITEGPQGYHLFLKLEHVPTSIIPFAQAEPQLLNLLRQSSAEQRLMLFLLKLRADAVIIDYTG